MRYRFWLLCLVFADTAVLLATIVREHGHSAFYKISFFPDIIWHRVCDIDDGVNKMKFQIYKRTFCYLCLLFVFILALNLKPTPIQGKHQEEVTVIALEVPVRVLQKGQFVKGLTKDDFELFENGIKQQITGFEVRSRSISVPKEILREKLEIRPKKRLFILIFNIFDYNDEVGKGIDYFFNNFFGPGDNIIIITEDKFLNIEIGKGLSKMISDLKETLKKYKFISNKTIFRSYQRLEREADWLLSLLTRGSRSDVSSHILNFYDRYIRCWEEYKSRYISPDTGLYQSLVNRLKQIEGEKWALCFLQRELFPKLKKEGKLSTVINNVVEGRRDIKSRLIQTKQWDLQRSLDYSETFPTELLKNLFMEANITFHLILLKSLKDIVSEDFELREVAQDYENCFKQISLSTGGHTTFSNKVVEALEETSKTEDYYYLIVYSPKEDKPAKEVNIKVKVNRKGARIIHLKKFSTEKITPISIANFSSGQKAIKFSIVNYQRTKLEGKLSGAAQVKITLFNENSNKVYDEAKTLRLSNEETHISIPFQQLKPGNYFIIIQVVDKITNHIDVFSKQIKL